MSKSVIALPDAASLFAQLLAEESLTVKMDRKIDTAMFEPERRVLTLPAWPTLTDAELLLFIAHEVGHALFTPAQMFNLPRMAALSAQYGSGPVQMLLNVVEDVRIERLIRRKYRGLNSVFSRGYHALLGRSFFGFAPETLTPTVWAQKTIPDRLNLYAKVGTLLRVALTDADEIRWYNACVTAETIDDVLDIVADMLETLAQRQRQPKSSPQQASGQAGQAGQGQGDPSSADAQGQGTEASAGAEGAEGAASTTQASESSAGQSSATSQGAQGTATDAASQQMPTNDAQGQPGAVHGAEGAGDPFAVPSQDAAASVTKAMSSASTASGVSVHMLPAQTGYLHHNDVTLPMMLEAWKMTPEQRQVCRAAVSAARREQSPILASMIAAFRANQSAWQSRRVQVSKSGAIDPTKLAQYKLVDDLFLRRRSVPDAQNHGFVLHIDWSGSMETSMTTVLWQVLHFIWFAESIRVPVEVYGFSDSGDLTPGFTAYQQQCQQARVGTPERARLIQLYASSQSVTVRQDAQAFLLALMARFSCLPLYLSTAENLRWALETDRKDWYGPQALRSVFAALLPSFVGTVASDVWSHRYVHLGGTPLYPALLSSVDTVRRFRQSQRIEQCVSVWLTDGGDTHGVPVVGDVLTHAAPSQYYSYERTNAALGERDRLVDPRSGRAWTVQGDGLSAMFAMHRQLTGATVVCLDICAAPLASMRRVLPKSDVAVLAALVVDDSANYPYAHRARRRSGYIKPPTRRQTRRNVVVQTQSGSFADTGMLLATQRQFPALGCDAYLVTHPDLWNGSMATTERAAAKVASSVQNDWQDDDLTVEERAAFAADAMQRRGVTLNAALLSNAKHHSMRKFADLMVPYMAVGRADATV